MLSCIMYQIDKETNELLETSIDELNDLAIVSLSNIIHSHIIPYDKITEKIGLFSKAERGNFIEIIDLFKLFVDTNFISKVKQVYEYRNCVAHGKNSEKPPSKIDPISTY